MTDSVTNLGPSMFGKDKGKAPATDLHQHNRDTSSNDRSRGESAMFLTPAPQITDSHLQRQRLSDRKRPSERMAELQEGQAAKRARTAASTPGQSAGPPRPSIEDVDDEGDELIDQSGHHGRRVVTREPGDQTRITSNGAGKKTDPVPDRVTTDPAQSSRNAQPAGERRARAAPRAGPSVQPTNTMVDLTEDDDEHDENNGIPPGHIALPRTGITAPHNEFGKAVRTACSMKCETAASTLSRRTDEEGKHIFHRCVGTAALLKSARTLALVRRIMADDVKDVLADANATLSKRRDKYNKYFEGEDLRRWASEARPQEDSGPTGRPGRKGRASSELAQGPG